MGGIGVADPIGELVSDEAENTTVDQYRSLPIFATVPDANSSSKMPFSATRSACPGGPVSRSGEASRIHPLRIAPTGRGISLTR